MRQQKGSCMASQKYFFYKGIFLNPLDDSNCEFLSEGLLVVKKGKIKNLLPYAKGLKKYSQEMTKSMEFKQQIDRIKSR